MCSLTETGTIRNVKKYTKAQQFHDIKWQMLKALPLIPRTYISRKNLKFVILGAYNMFKNYRVCFEMD